MIADMMTNQYIALALTPDWDLDAAAEEDKAGSLQKQGRDENINAAGAANATSGSVSSRLAPLARGLLMSGLLSTAVARYKQELLGEIKVVIRTVVAESLTSAKTADDGSSGPATEGPGGAGDHSGSDRSASEKLRTLPPHAFLGCMEMAFEHLLLVLRRAAAVHATLQRFTASAGEEVEAAVGSPAGPAPDSDAAQNPPELGKEATNHKAWQEVERLSKDALSAGCTLCCRSMSKLLEIAKNPPHSSTSMLFDSYGTCRCNSCLVWKIHGSYMMTLREVLLDLLKAFLEHFHESKC